MIKKTLLTIAIGLATGAAFANYETSIEIGKARNSDSTYQLRASDIIGRDVVNADDDEIGEVDDLIIAAQDDSLKAVVSVGGFLGIGDKLVLVPYNDLRIDSDDDNVYFNSTEDALKEWPEFNYNEGEMFGKDIRSGINDEIAEADVNWSVIEGKWEQFKGKAQQQWGELTNDDWDVIEGNRKEMLGVLQARTGRTRMEIEQEIDALTQDML